MISFERAVGYDKNDHARYSKPSMTSLQIRLDWSTRSTGLFFESRHLISPPPRNSMTILESATCQSGQTVELTHVDLLVQLVIYDF